MHYIILTKDKVVNLFPSKPRKHIDKYRLFKTNLSPSKQDEFLFFFWYCLHQISTLRLEQKYFPRVHWLVHARLSVRTFLKILVL